MMKSKVNCKSLEFFFVFKMSERLYKSIKCSFIAFKVDHFLFSLFHMLVMKSKAAVFLLFDYCYSITVILDSQTVALGIFLNRGLYWETELTEWVI
jgi:hypothetical protein